MVLFRSSQGLRVVGGVGVAELVGMTPVASSTKIRRMRTTITTITTTSFTFFEF